MNGFVKWIIGGGRYILADVSGQIVVFITAVAAAMAWFYFSSFYAAIPVLLVGFSLDWLLSKFIEGERGRGRDNDDKAE